jgi:hypothetical protein
VLLMRENTSHSKGLGATLRDRAPHIAQNQLAKVGRADATSPKIRLLTTRLRRSDINQRHHVFHAHQLLVKPAAIAGVGISACS